MSRDTSNYRINGVRIPSVTEVMKIAGMTNFDGIPAANLLAARERGIAVHEWTEGVDRGQIDPTEEVPHESIAAYTYAWECFKQESGFTPTLIECPVVNEEMRYAGTLDRRGEMTRSAAVRTGAQGTSAFSSCSSAVFSLSAPISRWISWRAASTLTVRAT